MSAPHRSIGRTIAAADLVAQVRARGMTPFLAGFYGMQLSIDGGRR